MACIGVILSYTRPLYLKRVKQAIAPTSRRSNRQLGDRTDKQAIEPSIRRSRLFQSKSKEKRKVSYQDASFRRKCSSRTSKIGKFCPPRSTFASLLCRSAPITNDTHIKLDII
ncbi:hypothetical protein [Microcoleus sp. K4-C2]|uniref:hypothetical protein n=1 Tax=Microcoleus sp. K4-C2 TaxID=2818792 RepID=UPI002FD1D432